MINDKPSRELVDDLLLLNALNPLPFKFLYKLTEPPLPLLIATSSHPSLSKSPNAIPGPPSLSPFGNKGCIFSLKFSL